VVDHRGVSICSSGEELKNRVPTHAFSSSLPSFFSISSFVENTQPSLATNQTEAMRCEWHNLYPSVDEIDRWCETSQLTSFSTKCHDSGISSRVYRLKPLLASSDAVRSVERIEEVSKVEAKRSPTRVDEPVNESDQDQYEEL